MVPRVGAYGIHPTPIKTKNMKLSETISIIVQSKIEEREKKIEEILRTIVQPPIKGDITKGKMKWRGITIAYQTIGLESYMWIQQRGKQIGPKFSL